MGTGVAGGEGSGRPDPELVGYSDRWSVAPGDRLSVMVSSSAPHYGYDLVRLRHGDTRPGAPGLRETPVRPELSGWVSGRVQRVWSGSCVVAPQPNPFPRAMTVQAWVWPTIPAAGWEQGVVSTLAPGGGPGWALLVDEEGRPVFRVVTDRGSASVRGAVALGRREWHLLCGSYDPDRAVVRLVHRTRQPFPPGAELEVDSVTGPADLGPLVAGAGPLLIAALRPGPDEVRRTWAVGHFEGKIERPRLSGSGLDASGMTAIAHGVPLPDLVAAWNFAVEPAGPAAVDTGPLGLHGRLVNLPAGAMTGHCWDGTHDRPSDAPEHYGALHFHADDLEDAGWQTDVVLDVPADLPSGVYAMRLRAGDLVDRVPFAVRPRRGRPTADVLLVLPTLTYLAYANEHLPGPGSYLRRSLSPAEAGEPDRWLATHPELGMSLYDRHRDGSGCCYSSRLRPIPSLRPTYLSPLLGFPRHLAADLYLVDWLEEKGIGFEVATDEDLHEEGLELVTRYRVVLTGTHPEYVTGRMTAALGAYVHGGGRLLYLGGNGFYWVTSIDPRRPHVIEVRRGGPPEKAWTSCPGELHHATTGERGGLWALRGRPPDALVGVGFAAMGREREGCPPAYHRLEGSFRPETAWIFDGVSEEGPIGDFGLIMGTAAGHEIDRYEPGRGSPPATVLLARSSGHAPDYQVAVEDLSSRYLRQILQLAGRPHPNVHADLTYLDTPAGGAVFSVSSMTWAGALSHDDYRNPVSRITENVLRGFLRPDLPGRPSHLDPQTERSV